MLAPSVSVLLIVLVGVVVSSPLRSYQERVADDAPNHIRVPRGLLAIYKDSVNNPSRTSYRLEDQYIQTQNGNGYGNGYRNPSYGYDNNYGGNNYPGYGYDYYYGAGGAGGQYDEFVQNKQQLDVKNQRDLSLLGLAL